MNRGRSAGFKELRNKVGARRECLAGPSKSTRLGSRARPEFVGGAWQRPRARGIDHNAPNDRRGAHVEQAGDAVGAHDMHAASGSELRGQLRIGFMK